MIYLIYTKENLSVKVLNNSTYKVERKEQHMDYSYKATKDIEGLVILYSELAAEYKGNWKEMEEYYKAEQATAEYVLKVRKEMGVK